MRRPPRAIDFMSRQKQAGKPFFAWMNFTRMHVFTHVRAAMRSAAGMPGNEYADGMLEMDDNVGKLLKGSTTWASPTTPLSSSRLTMARINSPSRTPRPRRSAGEGHELGGRFRVPCFVRWPGQIKAGSVSNEIFSGLDWFPTLLAAAGDAGIKDRLLKGWKPEGGDTEFKNHLDGFNQLDYLTGRADQERPHRIRVLR